MLSLESVTLSLGSKTLLKDAQLQIHTGEKVGLIGRNGAGKSSLFGLIRKQLKEDAGEVFLPKNAKLCFIEQEIPEESLSLTALDYVLTGYKEWWTLHQKIQQAQLNEEWETLAHDYEAFENIDGSKWPSIAASLLDGLGFAQPSHSSLVKEFSGGWQMRLNLAKALLTPSDLLLLDEPTNHLDLPGIIWLEEWLKNTTSTVLVIAHDSRFLDKIINKIAWINEQKITTFKGNYSSFIEWREQEMKNQSAAYNQQQKKIDHLNSFINRFKAKATKAKQAQSRIKALEKMERISQVRDESTINLEFPSPEQGFNPLFEFKEANLGYEDNLILDRVRFSLADQERIGVLGANGEGKSTLIKTIAGSIPLLSGQYLKHPSLKIGYFAQHQLDLLDPNQGALWHLGQISGISHEQKLRSFLGKFGFYQDGVFTHTGLLSGGEKARLALALLAWEEPHLLLLDEPTNHLDMQMRQSLALALSQYSGSVLIVSHDRDLLETLVDKFILVEDGNVRDFDGDLTDYEAWVTNKKKKIASLARSAEKRTQDKSQSNSSALKNKQKIEQQLQKEEKEMLKLQQDFLKKGADAYLDAKLVKEYQERETKLKSSIQKLEEEWLLSIEESNKK